MPDPQSSIPPVPTNLILYGPPGTGKTYSTAKRAVELCCGKTYTSTLSDDEVMAAYEYLESRNQIFFVTFHQSYTYEEFVDGLRPRATDAGGFSLEPKQGVFVVAAEEARTKATPPPETESDVYGNFHKLQIGFATETDPNKNFGYFQSDDETHDDTDPFPRVQETGKVFLALKEQVEAEGHGNRVAAKAKFGAMERGDLLFLTNNVTGIVAIARVTDEGGAALERDNRPVLSRSIKCLWRSEEASDESLLKEKFATWTFHNVASHKINLVALEKYINNKNNNSDNKYPLITPYQYVLVVDEINRANVSKVFGELITVIEPDKRLGKKFSRKIMLPYSREAFGVPANLHIIGTMNTADRSIALLDTALRRRFTFEEVMPDPECLREVATRTGIDLPAVLSAINARIEYLFDRDHQIGHAYFMGEDVTSAAAIHRIMFSKIIPLLVEYFYDDWEKIRIVLNDIDDNAPLFIRRTILPAVTTEAGDTRYRYSVLEPKSYDDRQVKAARDRYTKLVGTHPSTSVRSAGQGDQTAASAATEQLEPAQ